MGPKNEMGDVVKHLSVKRSIQLLISAIDCLNFNRIMDDLNLYAICMRSDSIQTIRAEMNGRISCSAPTRQGTAP